MKTLFASICVIGAVSLAVPPAVAENLRFDLTRLEVQAEYVVASFTWGKVIQRYSSNRDFSSGVGKGWCDAVKLTSGQQVDLLSTVKIEGDRAVVVGCGPENEGGYVNRYELREAEVEKKGSLSLQDYLNQATRSVAFKDEGWQGPTQTTLSVEPDGVRSYQSQYDKSGKLVRLGEMEVVSERNRVSSIRTSRGELRFEYQTDRLERIVLGNVTHASFKYDERGRLTEIASLDHGTYGFDFSDGGNMRHVVYPDGRQTTVFSDEKADVTTSLLTKDGCSWIFSRAAGASKEAFKVATVKTCGGKVEMDDTATVRPKGSNQHYFPPSPLRIE